MASTGDAVVSGELKTWHGVTLDFAGPARAEDAATFRDYTLDVTFTNRATGETLVVPGYFAADGDAANTGATSGDVWRAHFNPPSTGEWTYTAEFRTGADIASTAQLDGTLLSEFADSGTLSIGASDKAGDDFRAKGMLLHEDGARYMIHQGTGEVFLKNGADSPENFLAYYEFDNTRDTGGKRNPPTPDGLHHFDAHVADWRAGDPTWQGGEGKGIIGAINDLADRGVNSVYFVTMNAPLGDGRDVWPWVDPSDQLVYDVSKLEQWGIVLDHMDARGVLAHVVTQETENDQELDGGALGVERGVYYRELIARFGHENGLIWNLGEENSNSDAERKAFTDYLKAVDPYDHPVVVHTFPGQQETVYTPLLGKANFDGASLQASGTTDGHADVLRWVEESEAAGEPWLVALDEWGGASDGILPDGATGAAANHDAWLEDGIMGSLMGGGYGFEVYHGYDWPHSDLTLEDFGSRAEVYRWGGNVVDYFLKALPVMEMKPMDSLTASTSDMVFAKPGEVYAVFLPDGGSADLNLSAGIGKTFAVEWFNPRTGATQAGADVQGGGSSVNVGASPFGANDALAVLKADGGGPEEPPPPPSGGEAPTDIAVDPAAFDEEAAYSGALTAADADSTAFIYALLNDPTGGLFAVSGDQLSLTQPVDFESLPAGFTDDGDGTATTVLTLEVRDEANNAYQEDVALTVTDVDEGGTPPVTLAATAAILDGTAGPQRWSGDVTISALAPDSGAAVVTHTTNGFGVQGGRFDVQLDYIPSNNTTEQFVLEFSGAVTDVTLRFGRMNPSEAGGQRETGTWTAYDAAGAQVANGALDPANGTQVAKWTYDIPVATAEPFAKLVVEATGYNGGTAGSAEGDSSDFALEQLTYALTSDSTGGLFEVQGDQLVLI